LYSEASLPGSNTVLVICYSERSFVSFLRLSIDCYGITLVYRDRPSPFILLSVHSHDYLLISFEVIKPLCLKRRR
jgi:hypothetical protein